MRHFKGTGLAVRGAIIGNLVIRHHDTLELILISQQLGQHLPAVSSADALCLSAVDQQSLGRYTIGRHHAGGMNRNGVQKWLDVIRESICRENEIFSVRIVCVIASRFGTVPDPVFDYGCRYY